MNDLKSGPSVSRNSFHNRTNFIFNYEDRNSSSSRILVLNIRRKYNSLRWGFVALDWASLDNPE